MIRWSYVGSRLAVLLAVWVFFTFAFDSLLKRAIQSGASHALGAKVELGMLDTDFSPPQAVIEHFAAADPGDPWRNILEFQRAKFSLQGRPLFEKKVVVEMSEVTGIAWGTKRKKSGALKRSAPSPAVQKLKAWVGRSVQFPTIGKTESQLKSKYEVKPQDLSAYKLADNLQQSYPKTFDSLDKKVAAFNAEEKVKQIEQSIDALGKSGDPLEKAAKAKQLQAQVSGLQKGLASLRSDVGEQLQQARNDLGSIQNARAKDIESLMSKLQLPSIDTEHLSAYLLGPQAAARLTKVLRLIELARSKMPPKGRRVKEKAPRRGQTVEFPKQRRWPAFWLRYAKLGGSADLGGPIAFDGTAENFASNPPLVGRPANLSVSGGGKGKKVALTALLDHVSETPKDELRFHYDGLPVEELKLGSTGAFNAAVTPGVASVSGKITLSGDGLIGAVHFKEDGIRVKPSFEGESKQAERLLSGAFDSLKSIEGDLTLGGTIEDPEFKLSSNLGSALANGLKASIGKELDAQKRSLEGQVDKLVAPKQAELSRELAGKQKAVLGKLGVTDEKLKALQAKLASQLKLPVPGQSLPIPGDLRKLFPR